MSSRLFTHDKKNIVRLLTISLLSLGTISAAFFANQQFTKPAAPNLISKENAVDTALKVGEWNELTLRDKIIEAELIHVKANGFSFVVDENTLQDTLTLHSGQFPNNENQHLWLVDIIAPNNRGWSYTIDAATGEVLTTFP